LEEKEELKLIVIGEKKSEKELQRVARLRPVWELAGEVPLPSFNL